VGIDNRIFRIRLVTSLRVLTQFNVSHQSRICWSIAVSTTSSASASASAKKYSESVGHAVKPFHGNTSQIASDPDVDLVVIAVRAPAHKATLLPAIEAGKDVFVEWPAGVGLQEASSIAEAARKKGVRTMVGLQGRQAPAIKKVKEILESGKIGKILSSSIIALAPLELGYWGPLVSETNAYTVDGTQGASMLDIGVGHQLGIVTYLLGDFASISATTATHYPTATLIDSERKPTSKTVAVTAPDQVAFTGTFKSGVISSIIWRGGMKSTPGRKQLVWEIDGEEGSIRLERDAMGSAFIHILDPKLYLNGELVEVQNPTGLTDNLTAAWAEYAKGEKGDYTTMEDAVRIHRVLDAVTRSAKEGRTIHLE